MEGVCLMGLDDMDSDVSVEDQAEEGLFCGQCKSGLRRVHKALDREITKENGWTKKQHCALQSSLCAVDCGHFMAAVVGEYLVGVECVVLKVGGSEEMLTMTQASLSEFITNAAQFDSSDGLRVLKLTKVNEEMLPLVAAYLRHHYGVRPADIVKPLRSLQMEKIVADYWDAAFIDALTPKQVSQVILAANYLVIEPLLILGCAKIATLIKGKSPDEIREVMNKA